MAGATPAWANIQSISCSTSECSSRCGAPTRAATSSNDSHSSYEAQHDWWRDRYKGAADHLGVRPKIRDMAGTASEPTSPHSSTGFASATAKACSARRRNHLGTERKYRNRANSITTKLATMRVRMGIMGAYGEQAEQLGLGERTSPSRRERGTPAA
jgi:hypothetical protein